MPRKLDRDQMYTRAVRFRVNVTPDQERSLIHWSDHAFLIWNQGVEASSAWYNDHIAPLLAQLQQAESAEAKQACRDAVRERFARAKADKEDTGPYSDFHFNFLLTGWRQSQPGWNEYPTDWQRETLRSLAGAIKSWHALRARGDPDAHRPRERGAEHFNELICYGSGWKVLDNQQLRLSAKIFGDTDMSFAITPSPYVRDFLRDAKKLVRCVVNRVPSDLRQPGRWYVSLIADFARPAGVPFDPEAAVYVALGASSLGIVSPLGEAEFPLWRPDKHWMPLIVTAQERMKHRVKGSRRWKKLSARRQGNYRKMARQQHLNHCEAVIRKLLPHGANFVITDLVVRSKQGKLADKHDQERSGMLGANWAAQNTGSLADLASQLSNKAEERGGVVVKFRPPDPRRKLSKIEMAQHLREHFLASK
ncbi:MAG: helix-turn-helix domain-containing protein [Candidatus Moraniibacteriota bacterium]